MTGAQIKRTVQNYLLQHKLLKVACLTNVLPKADDPLIRGLCLNYVCFCVANQDQRAEVLFLAYLHGLRKLDYDVTIGSLEHCLRRRQFGYVDLQLDELSRVHEVLKFIKENKQKINRRYPILLRIKCVGFTNISLSSNAIMRAYTKDRDGIVELS